ncbi:hypothetical protein LCGC14_0661710 [marine sediment metagenome]|uniref:Uncharacterized protein n=1 Tax=marine sediment metagenome TaxID=412755 RepID=A0A0F9TET8_9ZZZZ
MKKIEDDLRDLLMDIHGAKNLVDDGKEVKCSYKLQGILTKCRNIYLNVVQQNRIMAEQTSKEQTGA